MSQNSSGQPPYGGHGSPQSGSGSYSTHQQGQLQGGQSYGNPSDPPRYQSPGQQPQYPGTPGYYGAPGYYPQTSWYDPHAASGGQPQKFEMKDLFTKPVHILLLSSAFLYASLIVLNIVGEQVYGGLSGSRIENDPYGYAGQIFGQLIWLGLILGIYCLVFFPTIRRKNWGRVVGFVFAPLGIIFTLGIFADASVYGLLALLMFMIFLVFVGVNIAWIVFAAISWEKPAPHRMHQPHAGWPHG